VEQKDDQNGKESPWAKSIKQGKNFCATKGLPRKRKLKVRGGEKKGDHDIDNKGAVERKGKRVHEEISPSLRKEVACAGDRGTSSLRTKQKEDTQKKAKKE